MSYRDFLRNFSRPVLLVSMVPDGGPPRSKYFFQPDSGEDFDDWITRENLVEGLNVYYHLNAVNPDFAGAKASLDDMEVCDWAQVDLDPDGQGPWEGQRERIAQAAAEIWDGAEYPTLQIMSGGGYHILWRLATPIPPLDYQRMHRAFNLELGVKGTYNADRLLKLPGTVAYSSQRKIAKGYPPVLDCQLERTSNATLDLLRWKDAKPVAPSAGMADDELVWPDGPQPELMAKVRAALGTSALAALDMPPERGHGDRSGGLKTLAMGMKRCAFTLSDFVAVLTDSNCGPFAHACEQDDPERAIRRAWAGDVPTAPVVDASRAGALGERLRRDREAKADGGGGGEERTPQWWEEVPDELPVFHMPHQHNEPRPISAEEAQLLQLEFGVPIKMVWLEHRAEASALLADPGEGGDAPAFDMDRVLQRQREAGDPPWWLLDDCPSTFMQDLMRAITARQDRPDPALAMGAAFVALASLTGNSFVVNGRFSTGVNANVLAIADSGVGKSVTMGVVREICAAAGIPDLPRPKSAEGLYDCLAEQKHGTLLVDEVGPYLRAASHPEAGNHLANALQVFADGLTSATGVLGTGMVAKSNRSNRPNSIKAPFLCGLWITTPLGVERAMSADLIGGGFMGRSLLMWGVPGPWREGAAPMHMPGHVVDMAESMGLGFSRAAAMRHWGDLDREGAVFRPAAAGQPYRILQLSERQIEMIERFRRERHDAASHPLLKAAASRSGQVAMQLAGALAAAQVTEEAYVMGQHAYDRLVELGAGWVADDTCVDYALRVVDYSLQTLEARFADVLGEPEVKEVEGVVKLQRALLGAVTGEQERRAGYTDYVRKHSGVTKAMLVYMVDRMPRRMREDAIQTLVEMEWLNDPVTTRGRGRPGFFYALGPQFGLGLDARE